MNGDEQLPESAAEVTEVPELTALASKLTTRVVGESLEVKAVLVDGSLKISMIPASEASASAAPATLEPEQAAPEPTSQVAETAQWLTSRALRVGAGLGGLVIFGDLARDAFSEHHAGRILRAVFMVFVLVAGSLLGFAWASASKALATQQQETLPSAESYYHAGLVITALAGIALVVAAIWAAV